KGSEQQQGHTGCHSIFQPGRSCRMLPEVGGWTFLYVFLFDTSTLFHSVHQLLIHTSSPLHSRPKCPTPQGFFNTPDLLPHFGILDSHLLHFPPFLLRQFAQHVSFENARCYVLRYIHYFIAIICLSFMIADRRRVLMVPSGISYSLANSD